MPEIILFELLHTARFRQKNKQKKAISIEKASQKLGYKDSNLENDGVRVRCLTIWR